MNLASKVHKTMGNMMTPLGFLLWLCKDHSFINSLVLQIPLILLLWQVKKVMA